ncbi:MAG: thioesterase family protein [Sneathiellaceae bacterium]
MKTDPGTGLLLVEGMRVLPEWIDYNGHMNVAFYVLAFDQALEVMMEGFGIGGSYAATGVGTTFVLENHVNYRAEVLEGAPLRISFQLLDHDAKRFHYFLRMHHAEEGFLSATAEQLTMHIDLASRRAAAMPPDVQDRFADLAAAQKGLQRPEEAGRPMGIRRAA